METSHRLCLDDARSMESVEDGSVELVVTSPPYPMIEMWDDTFAQMSDEVRVALEADEGERAYEAMHAELDEVWDEVERVLAPGGTVCVNVGDATRKVGDEFRVFPNHERVTRAFEELGFRSLPGILWRKPANSAAKFMGSGMLPPNAYVTLEHEHILVFRKGERNFDGAKESRHESAYFWEERNEWFSDLWEVRGERQTLTDERGDRNRSGAFPFEVPYRLVCMYSTYGDTVLDPFLGTGTTTLAAVVAGRNSVGYEFDDGLGSVIDSKVTKAPELSREVVSERIESHIRFVEDHGVADFGYESSVYGFPVMTAQEEEILFYEIDSIEERDRSYGYSYVAEHEKVEDEEELQQAQTTLGSDDE